MSKKKPKKKTKNKRGVFNFAPASVVDTALPTSLADTGVSTVPTTVLVSDLSFLPTAPRREPNEPFNTGVVKPPRASTGGNMFYPGGTVPPADTALPTSLADTATPSTSTPAAGMSPMTISLIGAGVIAAFFFIKRRK
jgi:hypothetical protein